MIGRLLSLSLPIAIAACASPVKLENVAGSWTCPRIDGVCATTTSIDAGLTGEAEVHAETAAALATEAVGAPGSLGTASAPARTADQVARIVLAPRVDALGHYHEARVIYAVMTPGRWLPGKPTQNDQATAPKDAGGSQ